MKQAADGKWYHEVGCVTCGVETDARAQRCATICQPCKVKYDVRGRFEDHIGWDTRKWRAIRKGIPWGFKSHRDLILDAGMPPHGDRCPILPHLILRKARGNLRTDSDTQLDRMNPKLGYVPGNCRWISKKANLIKTNAEPWEILMVAESELARIDPDGVVELAGEWRERPLVVRKVPNKEAHSRH